MNRYAAHYAQRRAHGARQADRLADLVIEGYSLSAAARAMGISQQRASQIWRRIKDGLGPQAWG